MAYVNLREYIEVLEAGKRPKGGAVNEGVPSLGGEHITNTGKFNLSNDKLKYVPREYYDELKKGKIKINDVLVVKDGATTGKTAIVEDDFLLKEACINEHVFLLRTKDSLNPKYLFYYFLSEQGQQEILKDFRGATVGGISKDFIDMDIYISDLDTQKKIVEVLDKAQELIDKRKEQIEALDELVKSRFIEMFGDPVRNPKGWEYPKIEEVVENEKNAIKAGPFGSALKKEYYVDSGYKIYGQEQVISGDVNFGDYYISEEKYRELENCAVKSNDVLISLVGTYGKLLIIPETFEAGIINPRLMKITFNKDIVNTIYFKYFFQSESLRNKLSDNTHGGTMPILNVGIVKNIHIPVPPIEIQNQFADFVKQVDKLKSQMEASLKELEDNFNSLMQKAFKGELF